MIETVNDDESRRARSPSPMTCSGARCPECGSLRVMADGKLRGVCHECGWAWDDRPEDIDMPICAEHEFEVVYYGDRCAKCGLFYVTVSAPWDEANMSL